MLQQRRQLRDETRLSSARHLFLGIPSSLRIVVALICVMQEDVAAVLARVVAAVGAVGSCYCCCC